MPLIEELPITQSHRTTHGWTYIPIPETGLIPIAAIQPGNRKRARETHTLHHATATAKQQKAIQSRLDSLDKENYKDGSSVVIPTRAGKRDASRKMSANVRRILTYQRGFAHYLADEEASSSSGAAAGAGQATAQQSVGTTRVDGRRKSALTGDTAGTASGSGVSTPTTSTVTATTAVSTSTNTPTAPRRGRPPASVKREREAREARERARLKGKEKDDENEESMGPPKKKDTKDEDGDTAMDDAPVQTQTQSQTSTSTSTSTSTRPSKSTTTVIPTTSTKLIPSKLTNADASLNNHPLLRTLNLPKMPSARVMTLLKTEPPLSYAAARAHLPLPVPTTTITATATNTNTNTTNENGTVTGTGTASGTVVSTAPVSEKPRRRFCGVCGYWGKIKCRGCGEWMCGVMECYRGHGGVCVAGVGIYS